MANTLKQLLHPILPFALLWGLYSWLDPLAGAPLAELGAAHGVERLLLTLLWLSGGFCLNRALNVVVWNQLVANAIHKQPPRLLVQLSSFLVFLLVLSGIFHWVFAYPVTAIWATSGALSLVIGFALKNIILDIFSGLSIHLEQPFKVGHWINCHTRHGDFVGRVEETNWRTTRIWSDDDSTIIVPNSYLTGTVLTNYSIPRRESEFEQRFTIDFSVDQQRVLRVIEAALAEAARAGLILAEPAPKARVDAIGDHGVVYKAKYTIDPARTSPGKARDGYLRTLLSHLSYAGLTPSYPKQDVYQTGMPWRQRHWRHATDIVAQLQKIDLFSPLSETDIHLLANRLQVFDYDAGTSIVTQGETEYSMFVLAEGLLEVFVDGDDGRPVKVADLSPGSFFGEKSLLTGEPRSATVKAATRAVVCEITKEEIRELMESNPQVVEQLSRVLAERELSTVARLSESRKENDSERVEATSAFVSKIKLFFGL